MVKQTIADSADIVSGLEEWPPEHICKPYSVKPDGAPDLCITCHKEIAQGEASGGRGTPQSPTEDSLLPAPSPAEVKALVERLKGDHVDCNRHPANCGEHQLHRRGTAHCLACSMPMPCDAILAATALESLSARLENWKATAQAEAIGNHDNFAAWEQCRDLLEQRERELREAREMSRVGDSRIIDYLRELTPDIGCGDDPNLFLVASHGMLRAERDALRVKLAEIIKVCQSNCCINGA